MSAINWKPSTPILEGAYRIARRADVGRRSVGKRLAVIGSILILGLVIATVALVWIRMGASQGERGHLLAAFVLLGSVAVILASVTAMLVTLWSAYVYVQVRNLYQEEELRNIADLTNRIADEARRRGIDPRDLGMSEDDLAAICSPGV